MTRICVFIDGSGFYFGLKGNGYPTRVDYYELSKALAGPDRELVRTFYYNSAYDQSLFPEQWKGQQSFLDSLDRTPYLELRLGRLMPLKEGGFREKGTEVRLAGDMVFYAARNLFDTAVILTENMDFSVVLNQVKELGKQVELGLFESNQPRELIHSTDSVIPLEEVLEKFESKIFPEAEEENTGNRISDTGSRITIKGPLKKKQFGSGLSLNTPKFR